MSESSKRSKVHSVRLTPGEVRLLRKRFGSVSRALRHFVDEWLMGHP